LKTLPKYSYYTSSKTLNILDFRTAKKALALKKIIVKITTDNLFFVILYLLVLEVFYEKI